MKKKISYYLRMVAWILIAIGMYVMIVILIDPFDKTVLGIPIYAFYRVTGFDPVMYWRCHIIAIILLFFLAWIFEQRESKKSK